jgi:hypothetical protein
LRLTPLSCCADESLAIGVRLGRLERRLFHFDADCLGNLIDRPNRREPEARGGKVRRAFRGRIVWDATQPNGQPRRCLDVTRAEREFAFRATTQFDAGLRKTVAWYKSVGQTIALRGLSTQP